MVSSDVSPESTSSIAANEVSAEFADVFGNRNGVAGRVIQDSMQFGEPKNAVDAIFVIIFRSVLF